MGHALLSAAGQFARGIVEEDGDKEVAHVGLVFGVGALGAGVVGHYHEYCVVEPWLFAGRFKEFVYGEVGILDAFVEFVLAFVGETAGVFFGHLEGMV